ncbi:MAG: hypothetical protein QM820_54030 [Minicystis sp.]
MGTIDSETATPPFTVGLYCVATMAPRAAPTQGVMRATQRWLSLETLRILSTTFCTFGMMLLCRLLPMLAASVAIVHVAPPVNGQSTAQIAATVKAMISAILKAISTASAAAMIRFSTAMMFIPRAW